MAIDRIVEGAVRETVNSGKYRLTKGACVRLFLTSVFYIEIVSYFFELHNEMDCW